MSKSTKQFKTEVQDLLNLVINSLYSNKDIFLRELLSNSSDAIDKLRFEAVSNKKFNFEQENAKIKIFIDEDNKKIRITDTGIGMNREEVENNIGTIAKSGTKAFIEQIKEKGKSLDNELIGQFGVGFYSAFMVAKKITLNTLRAGDKQGVTWSSQGTGKYTIDSYDKNTIGTEIILELKDDAVDFLQEHKIRDIVKTYSNYIEYPVCMDISRTEIPKDNEGKEIEGAKEETVIEENTLNSQQALWRRSKNDIKTEEYNEFYKHISHDWTEPEETIHYNVEGTLEFNSILFIPQKAPMNMFQDQSKAGVHLYVKRVFIMDDCKALIPEYLRFVKGVVDSNDLPLNVSREILQEDRLLAKISTNLVSKILSIFKSIKEKNFERYTKIFKEFGRNLKEGVYSDFSNKEKLQELLIFESTHTKNDEMCSLEDYITRMPEDQKEIYYITGTDRNIVEQSPYLESLKKKGFEVLFFIDPIDEWMTQALNEFKGKKLKSILKGDLELNKEETKKNTEENKEILDKIKSLLDDKLQEVRFSTRLTDSACCLVADDNAMSAQMEKIYQAMNQPLPPSKRILELNPDHKLIKTILESAKNDDKSLKDDIDLLYQQALILEGSPVDNPNVFAQTLTELMLANKK